MWTLEHDGIIEKYNSLDSYAKAYIISKLKYKLPDVDGSRTFDEYCDINNFSDNIPEDAVDLYYKYNINRYINRYDIDYNDLVLETNIGDNVFNDVRKGGYIWYVTSKDNLDSIQKKGLLPKVSKKYNEGEYRYFPERIYFIRNNKDKNKLKENIINVINDKNLINNYIILRISLKDYNISLYIDTVYNDSNNIYSYNAIPYSLIDIYTNINRI